MRISIRYKIGGLIVALIAVIMGAAGIFTLNTVKNSFLEEIKLRGTILARNIAFAAEDPIIADDDLTLTLLCRDALRNTGAVYAYILDNESRAVVPPSKIGKNGEIKFEEEKWRKKIDSKVKIKNVKDVATGVIEVQGERIYEVAAPIAIGGKKKIGEVHVGIDLSILEEASRKIQYVIISITILGILSGILGSFTLANYMVRPIKALVHGVREIGKGNFDQRIELKSRDEIGELTEAFNQMAKDLKEKELIKDAFKRYVSRQVAEEILKNPDVFTKSLRGEKRKVTVIFADIRGFTPLSERLPPEEVVEILNFYLTQMTDIIFKYEGTIDKFIGDCIMAVFGAPLSHVDDVYRAVRSAVEIQENMEQLNIKRIKEGKEAIHVGVGINFGEAVVGNIGSKERLEYTVIGDSVNLAARLQTLAKGGEIIVSEHVYTFVKDKFNFLEMPPERVKGKSHPVRIFKIKIPTAEERVGLL